MGQGRVKEEWPEASNGWISKMSLYSSSFIKAKITNVRG